MLTLKATPGPTTYFLRLLRALDESDRRAELDARRGLRWYGYRVAVDRMARKQTRKAVPGLTLMSDARDTPATKKGPGEVEASGSRESPVSALAGTRNLP